ncbi:MAG: LEA type 2 family protein [Leptospiraceae bacterium]|nr:LEA type 2 family protein [Leptospiraceae bacterium]
MHARRYARLTLLVAVFPLTLQCASLAKKIFDPPQVGVAKVEFSKVDLTGVDLIVHVKIHNPNSVGATLNRIEYAFDVEGERLLKGTKADKTKILSNDTSLIPLPVSISYAGLKSGIAGALSKKSLPFAFQGKVVLDTPIGDLSFDIAEKGEIPVPDRPRFDLEKIALGEFSVTSATLMVHIKVSNNHDLELDIEKFRYEFSLQDNLISASEISVQRSLAQDKSMSVALPITVKLLGLKRSVVDMIKSGQIKYFMKFDLNLKTRFGPVTVPYERDGLTSLY